MLLDKSRRTRFFKQLVDALAVGIADKGARQLGVIGHRRDGRLVAVDVYKRQGDGRRCGQL